MKTYIKLALGAILAVSMGVAQATSLSGKLDISGFGSQTNIDVGAGTISFTPNPGTLNVDGATGDLSVFAPSGGFPTSFGQIIDADTAALTLVNFLVIANGNTPADFFTFDLVTLVLTSDAAGRHAIGSGNATFIDAAGGIHQDTMTFTMSQQAGTGKTSWSATVPEPATLAMFGLGLIGLGFAKRKKA